VERWPSSAAATNEPSQTLATADFPHENTLRILGVVYGGVLAADGDQIILAGTEVDKLKTCEQS
jgi:hypothetical protein